MDVDNPVPINETFVCTIWTVKRCLLRQLTPSVVSCSRESPAFTPATTSIAAWRDLHDARDIAADTGGPATTYVGFDDDAPMHSDETNTRIDHILVTPQVKVSRVFTVVPDGESSGVPPSDHRPVLADIKLT